MVGVDDFNAKCPRCKRSNCYAWFDSHMGEDNLFCPDCGFQRRILQMVDKKKSRELRISQGVDPNEKFPKIWKQTKRGAFIFRVYYYDEGKRKKKDEMDFNKKPRPFPEKRALVGRMYLEGYKLKYISAASGFSITTINRWAKKFKWDIKYQKWYDKEVGPFEADNYLKFQYKKEYRDPK
jgi:transposase-like protein